MTNLNLNKFIDTFIISNEPKIEVQWLFAVYYYGTFL